MNARKQTVRYIASTASSLITDIFRQTHHTTPESSERDPQVAIRAITEMCTKNIRSEHPSDTVVIEGAEEDRGTNSIKWMIDPLDGVDNFRRGLPICGFQLAILENDVAVYAIIIRPFTQEWFTVEKNRVSEYYNFLTGEKALLSVSKRSLDQAVGLFDATVGTSDNAATQLLASVADEISSVRVLGVSSFDIPAVASGSAELLITGSMNIFDALPGILLLEEAGGEVFDLKGNRPQLEDNFMMFAPKSLKDPLLKEIKRLL